MKTILLKVKNLPNNVDVDLFVYCMQQDIEVSYPHGKVEIVTDIRQAEELEEGVIND